MGHVPARGTEGDGEQDDDLFSRGSLLTAIIQDLLVIGLLAVVIAVVPHLLVFFAVHGVEATIITGIAYLGVGTAAVYDLFISFNDADTLYVRFLEGRDKRRHHRRMAQIRMEREEQQLRNAPIPPLLQEHIESDEEGD